MKFFKIENIFIKVINILCFVSICSVLILFSSNINSQIKEKTISSKIVKPLFEKTLAIIKPEAVKAKNSGEIIRIIELNNFEIKYIKRILLNRKQAESFYGVHNKKPFFKDLVNYITSGPIIILVLEKENAIQDWRNLMGSTNPQSANVGTIRKMFGKSIQENSVHGSDSKENALKEIEFFTKL